MLIIAVFSFFYWFFLSIPVGAIQIEIARRAFNGYLKSAIAIIIGSVISDFIYGIVALLGVFQFLAIPQIRPFFWLFGAILLSVLGIIAIRNFFHPHEVTHSTSILTKKRYSLITGFFVAASNPLIIIGWITGAEVARRIGVMHYSGFYNLAVFIIAGTLGLGVYLLMIALILYRVRHFLSEKVIRITSLIFGLILIGLGVYFLVEAILELTGYHSSLPMNGSDTFIHTLTNFNN
ncbi:LysE family transporter [candidate division KSB1 bacterium]|nr:LysE family transporter [candidate division KSB1 bacterium]